jgi:hypothetical protein
MPISVNFLCTSVGFDHRWEYIYVPEDCEKHARKVNEMIEATTGIYGAVDCDIVGSQNSAEISITWIMPTWCSSAQLNNRRL